MSATKCSSHPENEAVYRCDGCGELLCADCVDEGHRLLFCGLCGERALPLDDQAPAVTTELRRTAMREAPYSLVDALRYPFRGLGRYVYWGYVIVLVIFLVLGAIPGLGCAVVILELTILLMLPGLLFAIVRTTAEGEDELPDWPDWIDVGQRLWEWFGALLVFLISALPVVTVLWLLGCALEEVIGSGRLVCSVGLLVGSIAGAAIWIPAFGAVATEWNPWVALRVDLHVRALGVLGADGWQTLGLLVGLLALRQLVATVVQPVPLLGSVLQIVVGVYALLTGAHFVGLLFRRHAAVLDSIYN